MTDTDPRALVARLTGFTPGPWNVGPIDDTRVEDTLGNEVAQIDGDYNQPETWPVMEANARLIAAAPDLLAAVTTALDEIERLRATLSTITATDCYSRDEVTNMARAALKRYDQ